MPDKNKKNPPLFEGANWDKYRKYLISKEADRRTVDSESLAHHNKGGYLGIYQMGVSALVDAGFLKKESLQLRKDGLSQKEVMSNNANWTKGNSYDSFISSEDKQSQALKVYTEKNYNSIKGTLNKKGLTDPNDIYASLTTAHLGGSGNARALLNGEKTKWTDANGTSMQSYSTDFYSFAQTPQDKLASYRQNKERLDEIQNNDRLSNIEKSDQQRELIGKMSITERNNFLGGRELEQKEKERNLAILNDTSTDEGFMLNLLKNSRSDFGLDGKNQDFEMDLGNKSKEEIERIKEVLNSETFNNLKITAETNSRSGAVSNYKLSGSDIANVLDPIDRIALDATGESLFYNVTTQNLDGDDPKTAKSDRNFIDKKIKSKFYNSNIVDRFDNEFDISKLNELPKELPEDVYNADYIETASQSFIERKKIENNSGPDSISSSSSSSSSRGANFEIEKGAKGKDEEEIASKAEGIDKQFLNDFLKLDSKKPAVFTDDEAEPSFGDFLKKNPNAPVSMALAVKGFIDAGKKVGSINVEDKTALSDAFHKHFKKLEDMSNEGFTPEEEALHRKKINDGFNASMAQVVRASGGNKNLVLANIAGISSARNKSTLEASVADAQLRRQNLKNFEEVLYYKEQFDERKDLREQANEYRVKATQRQDDLATKASGTNLAAGSIKGILDSISTYNETGPGSATFQMKEYISASIKDRLTQTNPETGKAYENEQQYIDVQKRIGEKDTIDNKNLAAFESHMQGKDFATATNQSNQINRMDNDTRSKFFSDNADSLNDGTFDFQKSFNNLTNTSNEVQEDVKTENPLSILNEQIAKEDPNLFEEDLMNRLNSIGAPNLIRKK